MPRDNDRPATGRGLIVWSGENRQVARSDKPREVVSVDTPRVPARSAAPPSGPTPRPVQTHVAASSRASPAKQAPLRPSPKPVPIRPVRAPAPATWSPPQRVATVDSFAPRYPTSSPPVLTRSMDAPPTPAPNAYPESRTMPPNDQPDCATDFKRCRGTGTGGCLHGTCALCLAEDKGIFQRLLEFLYGLIKRSVSKAVALFKT